MTADLRPYPAYRESELRGLERVPSHWDVLRAKCLFREIDERSSTGKEDLLSVSHIRGVTRRSETNATMFLAKSNKGHKICRPGDLVINTMWAWMGALAVSPHTGLVSPSYGTYRPTGRNVLLAGYAHQLLRTPQYVSEYISRSTGIHSSRLRLYPEQFLCIPVLCPPGKEQAAIVRFLNHATRRIADAMREKKKLVALLSEQKQAIIQRAVTRGLDPNVPLKPSGISWLGDMPEHWEAKRLKAIAEIRYGLGQPPRETETGLPLIRATNVDQGRIQEKNLIRVDPADVPKTRNAFLRAGEIIVVRSGALTADSAIIPKEYEGAVAGYDMVVTVRRARPEFIAMALLSSYVQADQLVIASMRAAQPHLNAEELGTAVFLLPPDEEQKKIVEFVRNESLPIDTATSRLEREIDLLREYRTRLVADLVTGKLDTREAAISLPAEVDEAEGVIASEEEDETEELLEAAVGDE